jgi:DMSO/TMAO reductase YedYZ molybdopterin-dependent catalytic subunit
MARAGGWSVEGWDYIGKWSGVPLKAFLERIGADMTAKYVGFKAPDGYSSSIDMATALHPQTILATQYDGAPLPLEYGFPVRLKTPLKLGFKQPKWITAMEVTNTKPGGYWEDGGYNWFSGV